MQDQHSGFQLLNQDPEPLFMLSAQGGARLTYQLVTTGLIRMSFVGESKRPDLDQIKQKHDFFEHWLQDNQLCTNVLVDFSQIQINALNKYLFLFRHFAKQSDSCVIKYYVIFPKTLTSETFASLTNSYSQKFIFSCKDEPEALAHFKQNGQKHSEQFGNINLAQIRNIPEVYSVEPLEYYVSPSGQFECTYLLVNQVIVYIHWKGVSGREDLEKHFVNQERFFARILSTQTLAYSIADVREMTWITKKALNYLVVEMKSLESPATKNWVIINPGKTYGLLNIILRFVPQKHIKLAVASSPEQAMQSFNAFSEVQQPGQNLHGSDILVIPDRPEDMRVLIKSQHQELLSIKQRYQTDIELLTGLLGRIVWNEDFEIQTIKTPSMPAFTELFNVVNTLQYDLRFYIDAMHQEIQERIRAEQASETSNRTKSQFLANMSHELRTPLNSLIGFTSILLKNQEGNLSLKQEDYLKRMQANGVHLLNLVNDILDLSKIESGKMELISESFDVLKLLSSIVQQFEPQTQQKGIQLLMNSSLTALEIRSDSQKIKQIINNLLSNAIKFTQIGQVTLELELLDVVTGKTAPGETVSDERRLSIHIKDTGIGVSPDKIKYVFKAFTQVDDSYARQYEGTGLGLKISQSLAHLLGGEITLQSTPGKGSCFSLTIPLQISLAESI